MAIDILSPEFEAAMKEVGARARREAFAAGQPVVYRDVCGCYVREYPDGRKFEIRFRPAAARGQHVEDLRELTPVHAH